MIFLRSLLFFIGQTVITIIYYPLTLITIIVPVKKKITLISGWGWLVIKWLKICCNLDYTIKGIDSLPNEPFVAMVKHQSAWETIALLFIMPAHSWVLKKELLKIPIFGWGLAMSNPIAIDRSQPKEALKQLLIQGKDRLAKGLVVVICPEGTRAHPGVAGKYNPGGGILAADAQAPVVPIAHNAGSFWPRNSFLKYPGTIEMVIGKAIETRGKSAREVNKLAKDWIESTVTELESRTTSIYNSKNLS